MNFLEYCNLGAGRTRKNMGSLEADLGHMILGLISESGELASAIKSHWIYSKSLDAQNVEEEIGDCLWYLGGVVKLKNLDQVAFPPPNLCNDEKLTAAQIVIHLNIRITHLYFSLENLTSRATPVYINEMLLLLHALCKKFVLDLETCAIKNIEKLKRRYPDQYTDANALNRADKIKCKNCGAEMDSLIVKCPLCGESNQK